MLRSIKNNTSQNGAVLVELSIVTFVFVILFSGVIDVGRLIIRYYPLVRTTYEAARYASTLRDVPDGCFGTGCTASQPSDTAQHNLIHQRIYTLLSKRGYNLNSVQVSTDVVTEVAGGPAASTKTISIRVAAPFSPILFLIPAFQMTTFVSAPYLYPDTPTDPD